MAHIYNTVGDSIKRRSENPMETDRYVMDLLKLYNKKDKNKEKENLLTVYLNNAEEFRLLPHFLDNGFEYQDSKVTSQHKVRLNVQFEQYLVEKAIAKKNLPSSRKIGKNML